MANEYLKEKRRKESGEGCTVLRASLFLGADRCLGKEIAQQCGVALCPAMSTATANLKAHHRNQGQHSISH